MKEKKSSIVQKLQSGQKQTILEGIEEFRKYGKTSELIELIISMNNNKDPEIRSHAANLLFDLKNQDSANIIVDCIKDKSFKSVNRTLISACWQSGLDFSKHLAFFAELVRDPDFENAFEAFTVVDNCSENASIHDIEKVIAAARSYQKSKHIDSHKLIDELLLLLEQMIRDRAD